MRFINAKHLQVLMLVILAIVPAQGRLSSARHKRKPDRSGNRCIRRGHTRAAVTLTNVDTNFAQDAVTDGTGFYQFKLVPPGNYSLAITAASFAHYSRRAS